MSFLGKSNREALAKSEKSRYNSLPKKIKTVVAAGLVCFLLSGCGDYVAKYSTDDGKTYVREVDNCVDIPQIVNKYEGKIAGKYTLDWCGLKSDQK